MINDVPRGVDGLVESLKTVSEGLGQDVTKCRFWLVAPLLA